VDPAPARTGSVDVARVAAGAIAEAEGGSRRPLPPRNRSQPPTGDDFVAPPLPEGMSVLGANVVAFALSTEHAVGQRVYPRFPFRLGGREVRCCDFRTTDLAQDWFLTNEGPERDRAGLDPDGDGFACNWSPERYRAEARAAQPARGTAAIRHASGRVSLSPNHGPRRDGLKPELVVLHYTAMCDAAAAERALCDPAREVSCHWLIARDGAGDCARRRGAARLACRRGGAGAGAAT
jgi:hypothetical protein